MAQRILTIRLENPDMSTDEIGGQLSCSGQNVRKHLNTMAASFKHAARRLGPAYEETADYMSYLARVNKRGEADGVSR